LCFIPSECFKATTSDFSHQQSILLNPYVHYIWHDSAAHLWASVLVNVIRSVECTRISFPSINLKLWVGLCNKDRLATKISCWITLPIPHFNNYEGLIRHHESDLIDDKNKYLMTFTILRTEFHSVPSKFNS